MHTYRIFPVERRVDLGVYKCSQGVGRNLRVNTCVAVGVV